MSWYPSREDGFAGWPALFKHAGDPALLQANALAAGLRTAACYLVVDKLVSADVGAKAADEVLRAALERRYGSGRARRFWLGPRWRTLRRGGAALGEKKKRRGGDADEDVGIVSGLFSGSARRRNRRNPNGGGLFGLVARRSLGENSSKPPRAWST